MRGDIIKTLAASLRAGMVKADIKQASPGAVQARVHGGLI